ncbi:unnamed protein product [Protopolystoma xenopodis]|uniref:NADH-ubiquinone oxidoreductase B14 subunit n=1 Tax=Protopolystoma xenopodis TaxID=117903 RepID=A0A3S5BMM7_9PLAT|nr:unnamed protein product [Protopolystoma xenopodis]
MSHTVAVRPIISRSLEEAKVRARILYRAWYRQIPYIVKQYKQEKVYATEAQLLDCLRKEFRMYQGVNDVRALDLLIHKVFYNRLSYLI